MWSRNQRTSDSTLARKVLWSKLFYKSFSSICNKEVKPCLTWYSLALATLKQTNMAGFTCFRTCEDNPILESQFLPPIHTQSHGQHFRSFYFTASPYTSHVWRTSQETTSNETDTNSFSCFHSFAWFSPTRKTMANLPNIWWKSLACKEKHLSGMQRKSCKDV